MNRLRKPRTSEPPSMAPAAKACNTTTTVSRTMQLAVGGMKVSTNSRGDDSIASANLQRRGTWFSAPVAAAPRTTVERYWAARALVAETFLSAHDRHQVELAEMRRIEEQKREREIGTILNANDQSQRRLEWLMVTCLAVLLGFMGWLVVMIAPDRHVSKSGKPSHFTIPILSPFASVVEHETGVFGTKAVTIFVLVIGIAFYAALRHRLSR